MNYTDVKELFEDAKNFAEGASNLQLKNELLQIQTQMYEMLDENRELRLRIEEIYRKSEIAEELEYKDNSYFVNGEGPYCTRCWDVDKTLVRKRAAILGMEMRQGKYKCPNCNTFS